MKERTVFCEECRDDVKYTIKEKTMIGTIRGREYQYVGKEAKCSKCGAYVDVNEISEANLKALYDVYRKENNIVSLEVINTLCERYAIGKRPLSILLGWGEHTFTRFTEGDIPTRQYSDVIKHLYEDPNYYLKLLEDNKDRLLSKHSYEKSRKAALSLIENKKTNKGKIYDVVEYLLNQCEDITPLALQKSLYYIQGFYYAFYGKFIFTDDCEAWAHGPVYRDIYSRYLDYHFDPISKIESFDSSIFTIQEKAVLDSVIKNICCYSGKVLEIFTHSESPWMNTRKDIAENVPSEKVIDKQIIADYFVSIKEKYHMKSPMDIKLYAKDMICKL